MPTRSPAARLLPTLRRAALAADGRGPTDGALVTEFVRGRDPDVFAALVARHGGMVLGVCRRVVGDRHAAEDAFQAVWLVLARRAEQVRPREQVGNWLYGVAYRTALKARSALARHRARERQVDPMPHPAAPPAADVWPDLLPILDAELARLPDKLRLPVVLCDLEGRPQRAVAAQLGVPVATLATRLATARRTLAARLTDRGVTLSGGALGMVLGMNAAQAVPPALVAAAVRAAGLAAGAVPATVLQLSDEVSRMMLFAKLKPVMAGVLVALAAAGFGVQAVAATAADPPALGPTLTDADFLKRVCLDLRGTAATGVELGYFVADQDAAKRKKVVGWLTEPGQAAAAPLNNVLSLSWIESLNEVPFNAKFNLNTGVAYLDFDGDGWGTPLVLRNNEVWQSANLAAGADLKRLAADPALRPALKPLPVYVIEPPDILTVNVTADGPEKLVLVNDDYLVRPDGTISLRTYGAVKVAGLTQKDATKAILDQIGKAGSLPVPVTSLKYTVAVTGFNSKNYYVITQLNGAESVNRFPITGNETVLDALLQINGLVAPLPNVWVARPRPSAGQGDQVLAVDFSGIVRNSDNRTNYQLLPGDRVFVRTRPGGDDPDNRLPLALNFGLPAVSGSDADFLKRAVTEATGAAPTRIEREYFAADPDPKKRAKLLDLLLKDPAVAKKVGPGWKARMLGHAGLRYFATYDLLQTRHPLAGLVDQLIAAKRPADQVLDALTAAALGRLPTDAERAVILAQVAKQQNQTAAWQEVVDALSQTPEARAHADKLKARAAPADEKK